MKRFITHLPVFIVGKTDKIRDVLWVLFFPLALLWSLGAWLRPKIPKRIYKSRNFVVCVGNIHCGGSGKTPLVVEIAKHIAASPGKYRDQRPVIMTRGYRRKTGIKTTWLDKTRIDGATFYGDEPWMIAHALNVPVLVGKKRADSLRIIDSGGERKVVIADDGFQDPSFFKNLSLVALSALRSCESMFTLPLGDLRDCVGAIHRADAVLLTRMDGCDYSADWLEYLSRHFPDIPVYEAFLKRDGFWEGARFIGQDLTGPVVAFCGINNADGFHSLLGSNVFFVGKFPNHHDYSKEDARWLTGQCEHHGSSTLVTTDKDWYKIRIWLQDTGIKLFSLRIRYDIPESFWDFLKMRMAI
jgi:tetraacyldisaccharide 4'-kinase